MYKCPWMASFWGVGFCFLPCGFWRLNLAFHSWAISLIPRKYFIWIFFGMCVCVWEGGGKSAHPRTCELAQAWRIATLCVWWWKGTLWESFLSTYHVGPGAQIQVVRLADKHLYWLSNLAGPRQVIFKRDINLGNFVWNLLSYWLATDYIVFRNLCL